MITANVRFYCVFMTSLFFVCGSCKFLLASPAQEPEHSTEKRRPNIVFIYADDHSTAAIGCYGSKINKTPNIDALAKQGMRFCSSFVGNSICGPARATVLTGLHSHANGMDGNRGKFNDDLPTFAKRMQGGGYSTAVFGKWHLPTNPNGFDDWAICGGGYYNLNFRTAGGRKKSTGYTTEVITDMSLDWIKKTAASEKPFCVWISHTASHRTWMPSPKHLDRYDDVNIPEPATLFDDYANKSKGAEQAQMRIARDLFPAYDLKLPVTGSGFLDSSARNKLQNMTPEQLAFWKQAYDPKNEKFKKAAPTGDELVRWKYQRYIKDYLRCVDAVDDSVGKVCKFLKENDLEENTIVVYSADQGFFLGEHGWYDKRWMYEPALQTPLIVRWPGATKAGSENKHLVQNIDISPTFIEMAGLEIPKTMHGKSLVPLLKGEGVENWRDAVYYHYQMVEPEGRASHLVARHYGVRTERYKLMFMYDLGEWEFYDLESDPHEANNAIDDTRYEQTIAELKTRLAQLRKDFKDQ